MLPDDARREIRAIVGDENISTPAEAELPPQVSPASAEEVAAVLAVAGRASLRLAPAGNFSTTSYTRPVPPADLVLRLSRMNRLKQYQPGDLTASMEAGITVSGLNEALGRNRQWLPLGVPQPDKATVGGVLAANMSGPYRLFYGTARDMVIGMRFATAEGKLVKSGGMVVKNVAGYDMGKLMIGSQGSLAVITDVNTKVFPRPATETTLLHFRTLAAAFEMRDRVLRSVLSPLALDLLDAGAVALTHVPGMAAYVLAAAYGGVPAVIDRCRSELTAMAREFAAVDATTLSADSADENAFWDSVSELPATVARSWPGAVRLKLSCVIGQMLPLLEDVNRGVAGLETALAARAGSGLSYLYARGKDLGAFCRHAQQSAQARGGFAVVENAPAGLLTSLDAWGPRRDDFPIMQKLKQAFDPSGVLNPGPYPC